MPKVTLPISHEAKVTTAESWSAWPQSHAFSVPCYILEPLGKEGDEGMREAFMAKSEVCVPHKPRAFVLSYLHGRETHRGLLMEHVGNNCKSRGVKGEDDISVFSNSHLEIPPAIDPPQ